MINGEEPKRYWFKNKKRGIGWVPATWEGWVTMFVYIISVIILVLESYYLGDGKFVTGEDAKNIQKEPIKTVYFLILFFIFMNIVIRKGEKLKPNFISKMWNKFRGNE